jgi:hypothetical protein
MQMGSTQNEPLHDQAMPWRRGLTNVRRMRRLIVVGVAALILAVPIAVSASHAFNDVPTSSTYHTTTARLVGAGITGGCGGGNYCPNAAVTRGQMAAFLNRGLGRAASGEFGVGDDNWVTLATENGAVVAEATLLAGGGAGGTAHAFATGTFNAWTDENGVCPCEMQAFLFNLDTGEASQIYFDLLASEKAPADPLIPGATPFAEHSMSLSFLFSVPSGVANDYLLVGRIVPTTAPSAGAGLTTGWQATLQVVYVPFNSVGANPTVPTDTQGNERSWKRRFN